MNSATLRTGSGNGWGLSRRLWKFVVGRGLIRDSPLDGDRSGRFNPSLKATNSLNGIR
jgi:hypothetical protein